MRGSERGADSRSYAEGMAERPHHRPMMPGDQLFAELESGADPLLLQEAG